MKKLVDKITENLTKRIACQPDSRCASGDEVGLAACICEIEALRKIVEEVHSWVVCAAISTPEDMAQNFSRIEEITNPEYEAWKEVVTHDIENNNKFV